MDVYSVSKGERNTPLILEIVLTEFVELVINLP